jgi:hypothetical protein
MRPVLGLGRNTVAQSLARRAPLLQSHTKNYSTPAEQGRATASHHNHTNHQNHREGAWTVERFGISSTLLIRCRQAGPLRAPPVPSCWPYQAGSSASWPSWTWALPSVVPCASELDAALHLGWSCAGAGALWAGHFMLPAGNKSTARHCTLRLRYQDSQ